jgi:histone H2A
MGKGAKGKSKGVNRSANKSRSERAGLQFPVGRVHRHLKEGRYTQRVSEGAAVYLAGVLEYVTAEVLELAGNKAKSWFRVKRIIPRHIFLGIREDEELDFLLGNFAMPESGNGKYNYINPFLLRSLIKRRKIKR